MPSIQNDLVRRVTELEAKTRKFEPGKRYPKGSIVIVSGKITSIITDSMTESIYQLKYDAHILFGVNGVEKPILLLNTYMQSFNDKRIETIRCLTELIEKNGEVTAAYRVNIGAKNALFITSPGQMLVKPAGEADVRCGLVPLYNKSVSSQRL